MSPDSELFSISSFKNSKLRWNMYRLTLSMLSKSSFSSTFSIVSSMICSKMSNFVFNSIQDGPFRGCTRMENPKRLPSLKSVKHILQWWKLGTIIPLRKIQKIYKSRDTHHEFSWHPNFSSEIRKFCYIEKYRYSLHFKT